MIRLWELSLTQPYEISIRGERLGAGDAAVRGFVLFFSPCSSALLVTVSKELSSIVDASECSQKS